MLSTCPPSSPPTLLPPPYPWSYCPHPLPLSCSPWSANTHPPSRHTRDSQRVSKTDIKGQDYCSDQVALMEVFPVMTCALTISKYSSILLPDSVVQMSWVFYCFNFTISKTFNSYKYWSIFIGNLLDEEILTNIYTHSYSLFAAYDNNLYITVVKTSITYYK